MGGEGQPQTQAALFTRIALYGQEPQQAVTTNLKIENRFDPTVIDAMRAAGHDVEVSGAYDDIMGHAGALVHWPSGLIEGASDPRSDGAAAGF